MKLISEGWRGKIYLLEENGKKYIIKKAKTNLKKAAIKKEIQILKFLKGKVDFVPQIIEYGDDWFKYEFIDGKELSKQKLNGLEKKIVYTNLVNFAYKLDLLNVEHGELARPTKNIIVNFPNIFIIDFERGNLMNKKYKNLRAIGQFFLRNKIITKKELFFSDPMYFKSILTKQINKVII